MIAFLLSIIFLVFTAVGAYASQNAVTTTHPNGLMFGGNIVQINEAPYHVSISKNQEARCAGVILSKDYVLTAAHCDLVPYNAIKVHAGTSLRNGAEGSVHSIIQCELHENYPTSTRGRGGPMGWDESRYIVMANDIALLKIYPPIQFDEKRQPIVMFDEAEEIRWPGYPIEALVTGWTNVNGSEHLTTKSVSTKLINNCEEEYKRFGGIPAGQICAAYPVVQGKTGCVGVSGGPMVVDGRLAGILSWGNGCVKAYGMGVYTEIAYYRRWINETMQKYNTASD